MKPKHTGQNRWLTSLHTHTHLEGLVYKRQLYRRRFAPLQSVGDGLDVVRTATD